VDIDQVLRRSNEFAPSNDGTINPGVSQTHGAATLDMRGLGQNRTLVLVNGQRATPNGFRNSVDVNTIPAVLIQRIETLTGGAAAVYGADAVAGVTNFILRERFDGVQATGTYNVADAGDPVNWSLGLTAGESFLDDRLNVIGHVSYSDRGELQRTDRDFAQPEVNDSGALAQTFPTTGGNFYRWASVTAAPSTAATAPALFGYNPAGTLVTGQPQQATTFAEFEPFIAPNTRWNAALFVTFEVADWLEFYARGTYAQIEATTQQIPVRTNSKAANQDILVQRNNPFVTGQLRTILDGAGWNLNAAGTAAGTDAMRLRVVKTLLDFGPLTDITDRTMHQFVFGVRGDITDTIRYDLSYITGENVEDVRRIGWGDTGRYLQAVNATTSSTGAAVCVDPSNGCVPLNIFAPLSASPQAIAWINGDTGELFNQRKRTQDILALNVTGDTSGLFELPAGPIGWAVGVEHREEYGHTIFGPRAASGLHLHTQLTRGNLSTDFEVTEYFGELRLPLLKDLPLAESLDLELAGRRSEHSRVGDYDTWKVGVSWAPVSSFRLRGSTQSVVRGPNIGELWGAAFDNLVAANDSLIDYCNNPAQYGVPAQMCAGLPSGFTVPLTNNLPRIVGATVTVGGGGGAIKPESGETFTVGFVFNPSFIPGLSVIVDRYEITLDGAISTISPLDRMRACYLVLQDLSNKICQGITRDPVTGQITRFEGRDENIALVQTSGWDISVYYRAALPAGVPGDRVELSYLAGITDEFIRQDYASAPRINCAGFYGSSGSCTDSGLGNRGVPEYRHTVNAAWTAGDLTLRGSWRLQGEVDMFPGAPFNTFQVQHIDTWDYFDIGFGYRIGDNLSISGTITNVFDKLPPILGSAQRDANTQPSQYDIVGRRFGISFSWRN
jgi:iron complex outermembrane recepter protein